MKKRYRREFSAAEVETIHERWREGKTQRDIGRPFDHASAVIRRVIARSGGITPPVRRRSGRVLRVEEREEIS